MFVHHAARSLLFSWWRHHTQLSIAARPMRLASVLLLPHLLTLGVAVDPNEATMEEMRAQAFAHAKRVEQGLEPPSKVDERAMGDSAALRGVERMYGGGAGAGGRSAYPPEDAGRDVSDAEGDYWRNLGMNMGKNAGKKKALEGAEQITAAEKCMACHASVVELERLIASRWRAGRRPGVVELTDYLEELCDLDRFTGKGYTLQEARLTNACKAVVNDHWSEDDAIEEALLAGDGGAPDDPTHSVLRRKACSLSCRGLPDPSIGESVLGAGSGVDRRGGPAATKTRTGGAAARSSSGGGKKRAAAKKRKVREEL